MNGSIYEEVNREFNSLKEKKKNEYAERVNKVYEKVPEIMQLDESVSALVFEMFKKAASGEDCDSAVESFAEKLRQMKERKNELLVQNGFKPDYLNEVYNCKKCNDTGIYKEKQCDCYKKLVTKHLLENSNLSAQLKEQTFSKFDITLYSNRKSGGEDSPRAQMTEILSKCKKFAATFPSGEHILFYGGSGLGKTFMSSAIANEVIRKGNTVFYQTSADIFATLDDIKFGRGDEKSKNIVEQIYDADLLIIDDLGTEFINANTDAELFRIINSRIMNRKSIIISTNLGLTNIKKTYTERIFSRIMGNFKIYKFAGNDIRCKNYDGEDD